MAKKTNDAPDPAATTTNDAPDPAAAPVVPASDCVRMKAPAGINAIGFGEETIDVPDGGVVAVPAESAPSLLAHGFTYLS